MQKAKVEISKNIKFTNLKEKHKILLDQKKYELMGITICHGKSYYRFRNLANGQINHLAFQELA